MWRERIFEPGITARGNGPLFGVGRPGGHHNQPAPRSTMRDSTVFILTVSDYHFRGMPMPKIRVGKVVNSELE